MIFQTRFTAYRQLSLVVLGVHDQKREGELGNRRKRADSSTGDQATSIRAARRLAPVPLARQADRSGQLETITRSARRLAPDPLARQAESMR